MSLIYYPKNRKEGKVKYLCICAHQDDNEIMAMDGVLKGFYSRNYSFALVVTTDGSGSARTGEFKDYTDEMMKEVRVKEQQEAAEIGRYNSVYFLNYTSKEVKDKKDNRMINDYLKIIKELKPEVIYTHSVLDKHPTHIAVALKVIEAIRRLPKEEQPKLFYGCEVWRGLDWVDDSQKVVFNLSRNEKLQRRILNVYKSQIAGGKEYAKATLGRRRQNATFCKSHNIDSAKLVSYGIDYRPLLRNPLYTVKAFALTFVEELKREIEEAL